MENWEGQASYIYVGPASEGATWCHLLSSDEIRYFVILIYATKFPAYLYSSNFLNNVVQASQLHYVFQYFDVEQHCYIHYAQELQ